MTRKPEKIRTSLANAGEAPDQPSIKTHVGWRSGSFRLISRSPSGP